MKRFIFSATTIFAIWLTTLAEVKPLDDTTSDKLLGEASRTWVIHFRAKWAMPSVRFKSTYKQVSNEIQGVDFYDVNVDTSPKLVGRYNIKYVPTVYIFNPVTGRSRVFEGSNTTADVLKESIKALK